MTNSAITLAGMLAPAQYRNKIINGNFDIWQRGITFGNATDYGAVGTLTNTLATMSTSLHKTNPYVSPIKQRGGAQSNAEIIKDQAYTADRWRLKERWNWRGYIIRKEFSLSDESTMLPSGASPARYYMEWSTEAEYHDSEICQRIEDATTFNDEKVTVSFYHKNTDREDSTVDRIRASLVCLTDGNGKNLDDIGEGDQQYSDSPVGSPLYGTTTGFKVSSVSQEGSSMVLSSSWQKYKQTFTIPSLVGATNDKSLGITVGMGFWELQIQPSNSAGISWGGVVSIAQVQVEKLDDTTDFEVLPPGIELIRCQRYFQKSIPLDAPPGISGGQWNNSYGHVHDDAGITAGPMDGYGTLPGMVYYEQESTGAAAPFRFINSMRTTPEIFVYSIYGTRGWHSGEVGDDGPSDDPTDEAAIRFLTSASETGWGYMSTNVNEEFTENNDVGFYWTADAEI